MSWIDAAFAALPDPRTGNAKRHDLLEILTIALTAAVCGAETCSDFADFAVDREGLFREFLRLENGVPSHDTFSRIFRLLDPKAFAACFGRFVADLGARGEGVIAIDGKTLRRSFDDAARSNPLAVVTAFASASQMVIGQESFRTAEGDSEIVAARALLSCLDLEGHLVTADALHCQSETAHLIRERGGDYLLRLKGNHPALHEMVALYFDDPHVRASLATAATTDGDHGRTETRRAFVSHDLSWMRGPKTSGAEPVLLPDMACLGMIEATVERGGRRTTTSSVVAPPRPRRLSRRSPRPLVDRERPSLEARRHLRRGPSQDPQGSRPGKPRHLAQTRSQHAQPRKTRHLRPTQTKTLRVVQRLRPIHHRPNAIALERSS